MKKTAVEVPSGAVDDLSDMLPEGQAPVSLEKPPAAPLEVKDFSADLVSRLQARLLPTGQNALKAGEIIKQREVTFELNGVECEPGIFVDGVGEYITFKITLRALNSAQEIAALRTVKAGPEAPYALGQQALHAINGAALDPNQKVFFWEALGMGGRQIVLAAFQQLGAASEAALGKYLSTRSES